MKEGETRVILDEQLSQVKELVIFVKEMGIMIKNVIINKNNNVSIARRFAHIQRNCRLEGTQQVIFLKVKKGDGNLIMLLNRSLVSKMVCGSWIVVNHVAGNEI